MTAVCGFELLVREGECVVPGDAVATIFESEDGSPPAVVRLGPGVRRDGGRICALRAGLVRVHEGRSKIWLEFNKRRYVPSLEDMVVGVVMDRHGEGYRVDIGGSEAAQLGQLSFEGATKRNRPYLNPGALVYARVITAEADFEPEISCILPGSNKSWITGESLFGELTGGGLLISVSLATARSLLRPDCRLLSALGESLLHGFECVVGVNGKVWVRASSAKDTVIVRSILRMADVGSLKDGDDPKKEIAKLTNNIRG